ncbi:hypothetical protein NP233_g5876 [Leucocoprinus birnbaumii]|uniref:Uncharacterized protein n=1 Tax=Leucocoprinus birnbaumii TaxID=56174 RepID=A0AAD5YRH0_9AGAR|nr:hypothetical protein NP233_g5876 [Leucocoprinus birnbaumii]
MKLTQVFFTFVVLFTVSALAQDAPGSDGGCMKECMMANASRPNGTLDCIKKCKKEQQGGDKQAGASTT